MPILGPVLDFIDHIFSAHQDVAIAVLSATSMLLFAALVILVIRLLSFNSSNVAKSDERSDKQVTSLIEMATTLFTPLVSRIDMLLQKLVDNSTTNVKLTEGVPNEIMILIQPEFVKLQVFMQEMEKTIIAKIAEATFPPGCPVKDEAPCPTVEVSAIPEPILGEVK